jgi:RNA polymerase-binding transcription factor DksA
MSTQEQPVLVQRETGPAYRDVRAQLLAEREHVRAQIEALQRQIQQLAASEAAEGGPAGETGDIAADVAAQETAALLADELAQHLAAVVEALERLDAGSYGRCVDCGSPIEPERLAARPSAARCLRCERAAELRNRHDTHDRVAYGSEHAPAGPKLQFRAFPDTTAPAR